MTWTLEDAKRAGLVKAGGAWTTYPRQMLWARAASQLIRELMPDATGASFYSVEERLRVIRSASGPTLRRISV